MIELLKPPELSPDTPREDAEAIRKEAGRQMHEVLSALFTKFGRPIMLDVFAMSWVMKLVRVAVYKENGEITGIISWVRGNWYEPSDMAMVILNVGSHKRELLEYVKKESVGCSFVLFDTEERIKLPNGNIQRIYVEEAISE